jgi:predicted transcriptional regulator of viral defense system
VNASEAMKRLRAMGAPVFSTSDAGVALGLRIDAASHTMRRLSESGLIVALRRGLWSLDQPSDPLGLVEYLTAPYPAYVSLQSALYLRGMVDQMPAVVYAVSPGRTQKIKTSVANYSIHHIPPEFFGGFEFRAESGVKLAIPEKAIVDLLYLSGTPLRLFRSLPELELPPEFRVRTARAWIERIESPRLRALVKNRFAELMRMARERQSAE